MADPHRTFGGMLASLILGGPGPNALDFELGVYRAPDLNAPDLE